MKKNLLYVSDNGFSEKNGRYYFTRPNKVTISIISKYFETISFIARNGKYEDTQFEIEDSRNVILVNKMNFIEFVLAMKRNRNEYDIIFAQNGINSVIAAIYGSYLGKEVISYCGADPLEMQLAKRGIWAKIKGYIWFILEKKKMKLGKFAHYVTEELSLIYPCECEKIICSFAYISIDDSIIDIRLERIKNKKATTRIGVMGLVCERKGIAVALNALKILDENYQIEIVGSGEIEKYKSLAENLGISHKVKFLGYLSNKCDIDKWLDSIDIYIQPSFSEGLPRTMIEAMARGCPVIATNISGMPSLIESEFLVRVKDFHDLANKIVVLSKDIPRMIDAAQKNFTKAREFRVEERNKKLDEYYGKLVQ